MFERTIWDKLLEGIFENSEISRVKRGKFQIFKNHEGDLSQKLSNQTCGYWLITAITG